MNIKETTSIYIIVALATMLPIIDLGLSNISTHVDKESINKIKSSRKYVYNPTIDDSIKWSTHFKHITKWIPKTSNQKKDAEMIEHILNQKS